MTEKIEYEKLERDALLSILLETEKLTNVGGWEWDIVKDVWTFSDNWLLIHGCTKRHMSTSELLPIAHPDDRDHIKKAFDKAVTEGVNYEIEHRIIRQDTGEERYVRASGRSRLDGKGKTVKLFGSAQDTTESKEAEKVLRESEEKFRHLFDNSPIGKTITYISGKLSSNAAFAEMLGYSLGEFRNFKWQNITHPDDMEFSKKRIESILSGKKEFDRFTKRYIHKNGSIVWADVSTRLQRDGDGNPLYFITAVIDISEIKNADEALLESNERFKRTESIAHIGSWQWDIQSDRVYWSEELFRIFGLDPSKGAPSYADHPKIFTPESIQRLDAMVKECINHGTPYEIENQIIRPDGEIRHCLGRGQAQRDKNGKVFRLVGSHQDITERVKMETTLLENEEKYRLLFENAADAIFIADPETGMLLDANDSAEELTGYSRNELTGKHQTFILPPQMSDYYGQEFLKSAKDKGLKFNEMVVRTKNGNDIPVEISSGGTFRGKNRSFHVGFFRDISERKKMYDSLVKSESLFKGLYDNMTSGSAIYEVNNDGSKGSDYIIKNFNKKSLEIEEKTLDQVVGKSLSDLRPSIDDYGLIPAMKKVWETGEPGYFPVKIYEDDRFSNYYENFIFKVPTGEVITIYNDVTDQKNAKLALKESETSLRDAQRIANIGNWSLDLQTGAVEMSDQMLNLIGLKDKDEALNVSNHEKYYTQESCQRFNRAVETARKTGDSYEIEMEFSDKNTKFRNAIARGEPIYDADGTITGLKGTLQDITERKRQQKQLAALERRNQSLLDHSPVCHKIVDLNFNLQYMSKSGFKMLKLDDHADVYGKPYPFYFFPEWFKNKMTKKLKQVKESGEIRTLNALTNDIEGNEVWLESSLIPVFDDDNKIEYITVVSADATQRKQNEEEKLRLEQQLQQSQKMESVGQLAGGIAHDFNNILFPILGFTQMSIDELPKNHPVQENLQDVMDGAKRARDLVKRILLLSRQKEKTLEPLLIKPVIEESLKFLRSSIPVNIDIQSRLYDSEDFVLCDETEIHEIVMNLCTNAYHSMDEKGDTIIVDLNKKEPSPELKLPEKEYLCLSISDNGSGIETGHLKNIFEPYFTTKEVGKGSGLGLSVVHGIVKSYQGEITVESSPGKGTVFNIFLPVTTQSDIPKPEKKQSDLLMGNENILFVDDEKSIVKLGTRILEKSGFTVTGAMDSSEALALFKKNPEKYDLIITDMTMPGMLGTELAQKISEVNPDVPVLICSGYSEKLDKSSIEISNIRGYLDKPILADKLIVKVRKILDQN